MLVKGDMWVGRGRGELALSRFPASLAYSSRSSCSRGERSGSLLLLSAGGWRVESSIFVAGVRKVEFCGFWVYLGIAVGKLVVGFRLCFLCFASSTASDLESWMESNIAS